jgi:hypothetical protein
VDAVANPGLTYAEETLGVHSAYEKTIEARNSLDQLLTLMSEARDRKRDLEFRISDREVEVASNEWATHPDMAVTRMEKHVKAAFNDDTMLRELREQLSKTVSDIEGFEFDRSIHDTDIRIGVARMTELGGYFAFLAALKARETHDKYNT